MSEVRVPCSKCGVMALPSTTLANAGQCMSCHRAAESEDMQEHHKSLVSRFGLPFLSNAYLLPKNKNSTYRERVLALSRGVAEALVELELADQSLIDRFDVDAGRFYVAKLDLTALGQAFMAREFVRWLAVVDRWSDPVPPPAKYKQSFMKKFRATHKANVA